MGKEITFEKVDYLGMPLVRFRYESCTADLAVDKKEKWATIYSVESKERGKGHATTLLYNLKKTFEEKGYKFGGSVALNETMSGIYKRLGIVEYI